MRMLASTPAVLFGILAVPSTIEVQRTRVRNFTEQKHWRVEFGSMLKTE
jgi:hypothetical protein